MELEQREQGFWWPKYAKPSGTRYLDHAADMKHALKYASKMHIAVQAGGHVGMWPLWLSSHFRNVITFEPEPRNYAALIANTQGRPNILAYNAGLSDDGKPVRLNVSKNSGGHNLTQEDGDTQTIRIDDLMLADCDLIVLDVEGYELPALLGARHTIAKYRPVIQLEDRGHGTKKGRGDTFADIVACLSILGYKERDRVRNDAIFVHGSVK